MLAAGHAENALPQRATATVTAAFCQGTLRPGAEKTVRRVLADHHLQIRSLRAIENSSSTVPKTLTESFFPKFWLSQWAPRHELFPKIRTHVRYCKASFHSAIAMTLNYEEVALDALHQLCDPQHARSVSGRREHLA
jgi:hypothetical protein